MYGFTMSRILVTGGSGFLGANLCKTLSQDHEIILVSRNQKALKKVSEFYEVQAAPLDVTNYAATQEIINQYSPEVVIHGAATKFVGLSERFPTDCVDNNVLGSQNVARACMNAGVRHVIGISTDKATSPIANIYGATKFLMERLFCSLDSESDTTFSLVRYGNVAWSTGSVFPLWKEMSLTSKKVESTGSTMSRFFFRVDEAVDLIRVAVENTSSVRGKILSLPMKGVLISRLLDVWSQVYKVPWASAPQRVGDRPFEILVSDDEKKRTSMINFEGKNYFLVDGNLSIDSSDKSIREAYTSKTAEQMTEGEIFDLIQNAPESI